MGTSNTIRELIWFPLWSLFVCQVSTFQPIETPAIFGKQREEQILSASKRPQIDGKITLTESTSWKMRLVLNDKFPKTSKAEIFSLNGYFQELEGYEPPQGTFHSRTETEVCLEIVKSRWMLSEDPNDRKDSLWVWGVFSEPLYPFLLLHIQLTEKDHDGSSTPWPPIYAQISHRRKGGNVVLDPADLKVRNLAQLNADPFGAAKVDIYEEECVGRISFQPV